jgi:hypothetical protein
MSVFTTLGNRFMYWSRTLSRRIAYTFASSVFIREGSSAESNSPLCRRRAAVTQAGGPTFALAGIVAAMCAMLLVSSRADAFESGDFEPVVRFSYDQMTHDAQIAYSNQDFNESFAKFHRLACAGDKPAQYAIGRMYLLGQGVSRDDLAGYAWLKVASEYRFPLYQAAVTQIEDKLSLEQKLSLSRGAEEAIRLYGFRPTNNSCRMTSSTSATSNVKDVVVCNPQRQKQEYLLRRCVDAATFESPQSGK